MQRPRESFLFLGESSAKVKGRHGAGHATGAEWCCPLLQTGSYDSFKGTPQGSVQGSN